MALRHGGRDRSGEMVFADVAMAALGPIALLMVLFMIIAGRAPECETLSPTDLEQRVEHMQGWIGDIKAVIALRQRRLAVDCPQAMPDLADVSPAAMLPEPLALLCLSDRDRVLDRLGQDRDVKLLIGQRDALNRAMEVCVCPPCPTPCELFDSTRHAQQMQELGAWRDSLRRDITDFKDQLKKACPEQDRSAISRAGVPPLLPEPVSELCRNDQDRMLEEVGVSRGELRDMLAERESLAAALAACIGTLPPAPPLPPPADERVGMRTEYTEFATCRTDFVDEDKRMLPSTEVRDYFNELATEVIEELRQGDNNRIDIFGHTDERPISGRCPNGATSNRELSALRAMRFADELERALRDADSAVARRLDTGDLRIYSIGVGEKEPALSSDGLSAEERWQRDRRIELRYVTDLFVGSDHAGIRAE